MADISRSFLLDADEATFSDPDFENINYKFQLVSGNLKPNIDDDLKSAWRRMVYDAEAIDRSANSIYVEVVLGQGYNVSNDVGGPAWLVPSGPDKGKGFHIQQNGNNLTLYQIDIDGDRGDNEPVGYRTAIITAAEGGRLGLELYDLQTEPPEPRIRMYYDGVVVGTSVGVSEYYDKVIPGISASRQQANLRGWTGIAITGLDLGGFSLTDINSDNVINNAAVVVVNGDFSSTTITAVTVTQAGSTSESLTINGGQTPTAVTCAAKDFHTSDIMPGAVVVEVTDGTDTLTLDAVLDFSDDWHVDTATATIAADGMWKDIPTAAIGDISHWPKTIGGSATTVDATTMRASLTPYVPNNTLFTAWRGDISTKTWTVINGDWSQFDDAGPQWDTPTAWALTQGVSDTYDATALVNASNGAVTYSLATQSGFTIAAGIIEYDGTAEAGSYWLYVQGTDADGTTTCPQIPVTVAVNPLLIVDHSVTAISQTTAVVNVVSSTTAGKIYVAMRDSGPYTTIDDVKNAIGADWDGVKDAALSQQFYPESLTPNTLYYYSIVRSDGVNDSAISSSTFTTAATPTITQLGKAPAMRPD